MAKGTKVMKSSSTPFVKGGTTKMFGQQHAGMQTPGQSSSKPSSSGGKFPKGGTTKMFGQQTAKPAKAK
jgi:hypothetical protein